MAESPIFVATPRLAVAQVSAANTNRDGTGTIVDVITGAATGTRITRITVTAIVTTTAGMVRLYIYDGSNTRLWKEVAVSAITVGASTPGFTSTIELLEERALILPSASYKIQASTHNAEAMNIVAEGGDF